VSRYIQTLVVILIFFLAGCSVKQTTSSTIGQKTFENEDYLILAALEEQQKGMHENAMGIYKILYKKSGKINYLIEATKISFLSNNTEKTEQLLKEAMQKAPHNSELKRIEIGFLVKQKKYDLAEEKVLNLLKEDKSVRNLKIAGSIYLQSKSYELALKYFESAYRVDNDENSLLHIVDILYNYLDKKDDAIALLETHIRLNSCELDTCYKLVEIYGKEKNIDGVISTYKKLYYRFKNEEYAKKVVELLMYIKDKDGAIQFLDKSGYNQEMLLDIYSSSRDFEGAYKVAQRLYKKTNKPIFLGRMAIYEYETNKDKLDEKILLSVSNKFEKVVQKLHDPLFLNYYGYLLIDHDIDVEKGIGLVQEALLKEPKSPFYLDSLAWGYYKLGKCNEAKEIMDKLIKVSKEEELIEHSIKINKCVDKK
jgi:tetratricopeptide (TPR) repeat protein